jgi:hypothetical protein
MSNSCIIMRTHDSLGCLKARGSPYFAMERNVPALGALSDQRGFVVFEVFMGGSCSAGMIAEVGALRL